MPEDPSAGSAPLDRAVAALRAVAPGLDATGLAEALWLASRMAAAGPVAAEPAPESAPPTATRRPRPHGLPPSDEPEPAPAPAAAPAPGRPARTLHERLPDSATRVPGQALALPRPSVLPRALPLARALRPWKRPWPAGRRHALDVAATVDGYARSGELIPAFSPAPERWFDVVLVVDRSPSMRVWRETVDTFAAVLDELGAFRTLPVRDLHFAPDSGIALTDRQGLPVAAGQLGSPDGRRLVVVVSDCSAPAWRSPGIWQRLRAWSRTAPVALLNPLPTKVWRRTGLDLPTVRALPSSPGGRNAELTFRPPPLLPREEGGGRPGEWLALPVLSLSPHSLERWSRTVMLAAPEGCAAVLVPPGGRPRDRAPARPAARAEPGARAEAFLRTASPEAARLAVLCSTFDRLSLDLLHVLRQELVPEATTPDLAELLSSGLFALHTDPAGTVVLQAPEEVRARLEQALPEHEALRLSRALGRHVAARRDGRGRIPVVAGVGGGPESADGIPAEETPAGRALARTLELLGLRADDSAAEEDAAGRGLSPTPVREELPRLELPPFPAELWPTPAPLDLAVRMALAMLPTGPVIEVEGLGSAVRTAVAVLAAQGISVDFSELGRELDARLAAVQPSGGAEDGRRPWSRPRVELFDSFWQRLDRYLALRAASDHHRQDLDLTTDRLLDRLHDPRAPGPWLSTGLVVAPPQSGRTTAAIGLAAKALDAGYRVVVVLAGTRNLARQQVQQRVDEYLLGFDTAYRMVSSRYETPVRPIGVGTLPSFRHLEVAALTSVTGDFSVRRVPDLAAGLDLPLVFVIKKNKKVVDSVRSWLARRPTDLGPTADLPLLVLDTAYDGTSSGGPSAADRAVHRLLSDVPKSAYVSFAYAPFVPLVDSAGGEERLYPDPFVESLPYQSGHPGPEQVLGSGEDTSRLRTTKLVPLVREVTDQEPWLPARHRSTHRPGPDLPHSLREAVHAFVLACAVRRARGQIAVHNSMLVSVSRFQAVQARVRDTVAQYVRFLLVCLRAPGGERSRSLIADLEFLWRADFAPVGEVTARPADWAEVARELEPAVRKIGVVLVNSSSDGTPEWWAARGEGLSVVAVGGTKLTQGGTLEGLTVAYYLRSSGTYESLLRLNSFFGYRTGYEDICRLYTTPEVLDAYGGLRKRPLALEWFSGSRVETVRFSREGVLRRASIVALSSFIRWLDLHCGDPEFAGGNLLWRDVPPELVLDGFLEVYQPPADWHDALCAYVRRCAAQGELGRWAVQIAHPGDTAAPEVQLAGHSLRLVTRKPLRPASADDTYEIKVLHNPANEYADLDADQYAAAVAATRGPSDDTMAASRPSRPSRPSGPAVRAVRRPDQALLTIYLIDPPEGEEAVGPLVGFAVSLPHSPSARPAALR